MKDLEDCQAKYNPSIPEGERISVDFAGFKKVLGQAYTTICEQKMLMILMDKDAKPKVMRKQVEAQLGRIVRYSKEYNTKIKAGMHKAILGEAESILLQG